jgi:hypothetical protein
LIGTKFEQYKDIAEIMGIDPNILNRTHNIEYFSAVEKLSWAAYQKLTREEYKAYSLLGLFDVN